MKDLVRLIMWFKDRCVIKVVESTKVVGIIEIRLVEKVNWTMDSEIIFFLFLMGFTTELQYDD